MVLIGTYELQSLRNLSGQLSRRSRHLHFSRYGTSGEDLKVFRSIIYNLQLHLPVARTPNLIKHWEYLYARSIGCTGILKDWLVRCLAAAIADKSQTITLKRPGGICVAGLPVRADRDRSDRRRKIFHRRRRI